MSPPVHTANPHEVLPLPQAGGRLLRRSCDALGRPSELRLGEAGRAFICFNGDPVRGIRRIDATPGSSKLEFAMGPWEDRADLAYQPVNTVFSYNGTNYDDFGRPETDPGFGKHKERLEPYLIDDTADGVFVQYRYGADGRLRQTVTPGGVQTTDYLAGANLAAARTWQPDTGQPQNTVYQYDEYQRLTGISGAVAYELNDADQRIQAALSDGTAWTYTYDDLGQLATATRGITNAMAYTYDTIGNRTEATEDGETTAYATNNLNQYTAINQASPTYDADGNLLTCHGWTYTWNAENRLIRATDGTTTVEANYDYLGRRFVKKVYNGQTLISHQHFLYDNFKLIAICDALDGNKITTTFTWQPTGPDVPLTMTHAGETCHYVTDGNKNVLRLLRPNGSAAATYAYAPFGQLLEATGPWSTLNPFRFSSEYHDDETGLVYYNYRNYNPAMGRWLSRDPIAERGGLNLYGFVKNSVINVFDLLGLDWTVECVLKIFCCKDEDKQTIRQIQDMKINIYQFGKVVGYNDGWFPGTRTDETDLSIYMKGYTEGKSIAIRSDLSCEEAASTLKHEMYHAENPPTEENLFENEIQARIIGEEFNIRHDLPETRPGYRNEDGTVNEEAIRKEVESGKAFPRSGGGTRLKKFDFEDTTKTDLAAWDCSNL